MKEEQELARQNAIVAKTLSLQSLDKFAEECCKKLGEAINKTDIMKSVDIFITPKEDNNDSVCLRYRYIKPE